MGNFFLGRRWSRFFLMPGPGITITAHSSGDAEAWENVPHQNEVGEDK
jgi:hypothetical protein